MWEVMAGLQGKRTSLQLALSVYSQIFWVGQLECCVCAEALLTQFWATEAPSEGEGPKKCTFDNFIQIRIQTSIVQALEKKEIWTKSVRYLCHKGKRSHPDNEHPEGCKDSGELTPLTRKGKQKHVSINIYSPSGIWKCSCLRSKLKSFLWDFVEVILILTLCLCCFILFLWNK